MIKNMKSLTSKKSDCKALSMKEYPSSLREYNARANTMTLQFLKKRKYKYRKKLFIYLIIYIPKFLYDSSTCNCKWNSCNSSNGQRYSHGKLCWAQVLKKPEKVGFNETPNASTNKENNKEHKNMWSDDELPKILETRIF